MQPVRVVHHIPGHENLPYLISIHGKQPLIHTHQLRLSNCRQRLFFIQRTGMDIHAQLGSSRSHGTGGNQHHFSAGILDIRKGADQRFHTADIEPTRFCMGQRRGSNFHGDPATSLYVVHSFVKISIF